MFVNFLKQILLFFTKSLHDNIRIFGSVLKSLNVKVLFFTSSMCVLHINVLKRTNQSKKQKQNKKTTVLGRNRHEKFNERIV